MNKLYKFLLNIFKTMKKLMLFWGLFSATLIQAQCDLSKYWIKLDWQEGGTIYFKNNAYKDTCVSFTCHFFDYQTQQYLRVNDDRISGYVYVEEYSNVPFSRKKGKYRMDMKLRSKCKGCDTVISVELNIPSYGSESHTAYFVNPFNCYSYQFIMNDFKDSNINYHYRIYDAKYLTRNMTDSQWINMNDKFILTSFYELSQPLYDSYNPKTKIAKSERLLYHEFIKPGRYLIYSFWMNNVTGGDSVNFTKIAVCPNQKTLSTEDIINPKEPKILGYFDVLGRPLDAVTPNEIYIILYDNGLRKKILIRE